MFVPSKYQEAIKNWLLNDRGNAAVNAVAGSGKSTTLEYISKFVSGDVAFLAFNRSIANELKKRLPNTVKAVTINSLGFSAVRRAYKRTTVDTNKYRDIALDFFDSPPFEIPEDLMEAYRNYETEGNPLRELLQLTRMCQVTLTDCNKDNDVSDMIAHYDIDIDPLWEQYIRRAVPYIIDQGKAMSPVKIDFTDQVWLPSVDPKIKPWKYDFLFVDEAQDLNKAQLNLVKKSLKRGGRLLAVGDPMQSIYGFSGADTESFQNIVNEMKCKELPLSICYRCPKDVVALAKQLVPQIEARSDAPKGIIDVMSPNKLSGEIKHADLILCRTNAPLLEMCFSLISAGVPARVRGRDIGNSLSSTAQKISKMRGFKWSQFARFADKWEDRERKKILKKNKNNEEDPKLQSLSDKVNCVMTIWSRGEVASLKQFKDLVFEIFNDKNASVWLSSIHRAKGLEADRVFIMHPELLPGPWAKPGSWQYQQEMSLLYVAVTRAKKELYFVQEGKVPTHKVLKFGPNKEEKKHGN